MGLTKFSFAISWPLVWAAVTLFLTREIWNMTYFMRRGIKGPMPLPFLGNIITWIKKGLYRTTVDYRHKYGKVVGVFFFRQPVFVVSDLDMVKDITVKHFNKFTNHKQFVLKSRPFHNSVVFLRDQHWRDVRNVITPTFSAAKMRQMSSLVNECCDSMVKIFGKKQQDENQVKVFSIFEAFTMESIAKCAFGLKIDTQNNPNDPFIIHAKMIVKAKKATATMLIAGLIPPIGRLMDRFEVSTVPAEVGKFFTSVIDMAIDMRKQNEDNRKDFLQLLLDVEKEDEEGKPETAQDDKDLHDLVDESHGDRFFDGKRSSKATLTRNEIYGQAIVFFIAGYETTNNTLGMLSYALATNPDVQDRLIEEIDDRAPDRDSVNYNTISSMPYLDCVVCETLRIYPPGVAYKDDYIVFRF